MLCVFVLCTPFSKDSLLILFSLHLIRLSFPFAKVQELFAREAPSRIEALASIIYEFTQYCVDYSHQLLTIDSMEQSPYKVKNTVTVRNLLWFPTSISMLILLVSN